MAIQRVDPSNQTRLISSGHIFVYEQDRSNIQRWTDGLKWSSSRVLDGFLVYRELNKPLSSASEKHRKTATAEEIPRIHPRDRHLYGRLIDSYDFKVDGLVKKTVAVRLGSSTLRLVSYYLAADVVGGRLHPPSADPNLLLLWMSPRAELWSALANCVHDGQTACKDPRSLCYNDQTLYAEHCAWHGFGALS